MQTLKIPIGAPVVAEDLQNIFKSLASPGILDGFTLTVVSGNRVAVNPGSGLLDSGLFIYETEQRVIANQPTIVGPNASDWTILYRYTPSQVFGGGPAALVIEPGLINPDSFQNGLILGWLRYPGASVAISSGQFVSGRRYRLGPSVSSQKGEFRTELAPFADRWAPITASPSFASFSVTEGWQPSYNSILTQVTNTSGSVANATYYVPFVVPTEGVGQIMVDCQLDGASTLQVTVVNAAGATVTPTSNNFFIDQPLSQQVMSLPAGAPLVANTICFIKLFVTLQPANSARFRSMGVSSYTEPF